MDPLGTLLPWIAAGGILGLLGVALFERLVPILPSAALLVAMGVAAAEEHWSLPMAFWSSTAGSLLGSLSLYGLGLALGEARSFAALKRSAKFFAISEVQLGRLILSFRRHERALVFTSQLIPSVRLIAPGIAGLLRANFTEFFIATTLGVALWNAFFLGAGYAAAILDGGANPSAVAMRILVVLVAGEAAVLAGWRSRAVWRRRSRPAAFAMRNQVRTWGKSSARAPGSY
jgi:membrane protein DedA with SNARE-associated domain